MSEDVTHEKVFDEQELQRTYDVGISVGLRKAACYIMGIAKERFERFADEHANEIRGRANELHIMANKAHPGEPANPANGKES